MHLHSTGSAESDKSLLEEGLLKLGLNSGGREEALLQKYIEEIELFNPAYGLVKVKDRRELIIKHIFDSLAAVNILRDLIEKAPEKTRSWQIADVGSGAGFPGIPLAIYMDSVKFTLIERMGRRAGFLRDVQALLGLSNVHIEEEEMEKLNPGRFDLVVFRAFRPLESSVIKGLLRLLAPDGILAAYKGRLESVEDELAGIINCKNLSREILPLEVPLLDEERHLVLIK